MVPRADFLDLLEDSVEQFERVGARPDGFLTLNKQGFALGNILASRFEEGNSPHGYPWRRLFDRAPEERENLRERANSLLRDVAARLQASGIAEIEPLSLEFREDKGSGRAYFTFEAKVSRGEPFGRSDERYAATAFSNQEAELFAALHDGCPPGRDIEAHEAELRSLYDQAVRATWPHVTHNLDWFILGFFKGVCCVLAILLDFDQEQDAPQINPSLGWRWALRQSVQCQPFRLDKTRFGLRFRCFEQVVAHPRRLTEAPKQ
jgi:hypothetical protein